LLKVNICELLFDWLVVGGNQPAEVSEAGTTNREERTSNRREAWGRDDA
jgi:hypothetical protein